MDYDYRNGGDMDIGGGKNKSKKKDRIRIANPGPKDFGPHTGDKGGKTSGKHVKGGKSGDRPNRKEKKYMEVKDKRFVNPYNFIPLDSRCIRESPDEGKNSTYTGYFDCRLELLTHLFIPNTSSCTRLISKSEMADEEGTTKDFMKKGYDFFSYADLSGTEPYEGQIPPPPSAPVIPGSEIRGAVRSVFEAAFNGCMSTIDGEREISRRIAEVKKPGILKADKNGWYIIPCKKAGLPVEQEESQGKNGGNKKRKNECDQVKREQYNAWKEGQEIWIKVETPETVIDYRVHVKPEDEERLIKKDYKKGYLHKGEKIEGKKHEAVFYEEFVESKEEINGNKRRSQRIPVSFEEIERFHTLLNDYRNEKKNKKAKEGEWYQEYRVSEEGTLVYYIKVKNGPLYLSPSCISKEISVKSLSSLLKSNGEYQPCTGTELCPACQVFGMLEKEEKPKTHAYGSKVRFTDAKLENPQINIEDLFEKPLILPEMGEPRPSAVEFYTQTPYHAAEKDLLGEGEGFWTYDYKYKCREVNGKTKVGREALEGNQPKIRGRKYYWHHVPKIEDLKRDNILNAMKQKIRPMKPADSTGAKTSFQFRVYFEQLSKKQLSQLKWALDFGNPDCAHKIGRAKPLGFGSVQIFAEELHIRQIDENTGRWHITDIGSKGSLSFEKFFGDAGADISKIPEALKIMANWKNKPKDVRYPLGDSGKGAENKNADASHQWFLFNKGEKPLRPNFMKLLPDAEVEIDEKKGDKHLYKLIRKR